MIRGMKRKNVITGLVMGVVLACYMSAGSSVASAAAASWQKAVLIQPRSASDFSSASFQQSVRNAVDDGANYINLVVPVHQNGIYTTDVYTTGDTPTDQSLTDATTFIHSLGARAAISIHDNPYDGQWRAEINPGDRAAWFASYGVLTNKYATLGSQIGLDEIVLGTELSHMTSADYNGSNTGYWNTLIQNVRSRYNGLLTYSSQHDGYLSDTRGIKFWDKLDFIGVSAYYSMGSANPSVASMKDTWNSINNNSLKPLVAQYGKPILFTEVGYQSKANSLQDPGYAYAQPGGYDGQLQVNAYQALMEYWNSDANFAGVFWWDWSSDPNAGGEGNIDYTPQHKPAEATLKQWFAGQGGMGGGGGGGGPVTPPAAPATSYTTSAALNGQAQTNKVTNLTASVAANAPLSGVIVDVEIYNANGQRVSQTAFENQSIPTSGTTYPVSFTPTGAGQYTAKIGVFTAGWQQNLNWNDAAGNFAVTDAAPPPPANPPTNPPATPPASQATLSIWWPGASQPVNGTQPFKARLENTDLNSYDMYWQVDGGSLNAMASVNDANPHKEAMVDVSGWHWNPQHNYVINFVAKDKSGNVISSKSTTITVSN